VGGLGGGRGGEGGGGVGGMSGGEGRGYQGQSDNLTDSGVSLITGLLITGMDWTIES